MQYPCRNDHHMTTTAECFDCPEAQVCDIYASMLDEEEFDEYVSLIQEEYR